MFFQRKQFNGGKYVPEVMSTKVLGVYRQLKLLGIYLQANKKVSHNSIIKANQAN